MGVVPNEAETPWAPPSGGGITLERVGVAWDAVRVDYPRGPRVLEALGSRSGAVIEDRVGSVLYWLVEPGATEGWGDMPGVWPLGLATYVTVPPAGKVTPLGVYWRVPYAPGRFLTDAGALLSAVRAVS